MPRELRSSLSPHIPFGNYTYEMPSNAESKDFVDQTARVIECSEAVFDTENFDFFNEYQGLMPLSSGNQALSLENWMPIHQPIDPYPETAYSETPFSEITYPETAYPETAYPETAYPETTYFETAYFETSCPETAYSETACPEIAHFETYAIKQSPAPSASIIPLTVITPLEQMVFVQVQADQSNFLGAGNVNVENIPDYGNNAEAIEPKEDKNSLSSPQVARSAKKPLKWTAESDQTLWSLKYEQGLEWDQVCRVIKDRSYVSLKSRYLELEQKNLPFEDPLERKPRKINIVAPPAWSKEDETKLYQFVAEGKDWPEIGKLLKRSPDSALLRHQRMSKKERELISEPTKGFDDSLTNAFNRWTSEEIAQLFRLRAEKKKWKVIAAQLNRTATAVRKFFHKNYKTAENS